jgi:hypothetical protein
LKLLYSFLLISIITISCSKDKLDCDNAQLCVKNIGNDTINYCWGCYPYTEVLLPGEKACRFVGEIHSSTNEEDLSVRYFDSDHGNLAIRMDACYVERQIE